MGLYDSVYVDCPHCRKRVEFQSKEGECGCHDYTLNDAPTEILWDIMNNPQHCRGCDGWLVLIDPRYPRSERPKPALSAFKVKDPENPGAHFQGFKWWPEDHPFTYDDLE